MMITIITTITTAIITITTDDWRIARSSV
jgi:hypothetical protein